MAVILGYLFTTSEHVAKEVVIIKQMTNSIVIDFHTTACCTVTNASRDVGALINACIAHTHKYEKAISF